MARTVSSVSFTKGTDKWKLSDMSVGGSQWIYVGLRTGTNSNGAAYSCVKVNDTKWRVQMPIILYTAAGSNIDITNFGTSYIKAYVYTKKKTRGSDLGNADGRVYVGTENISKTNMSLQSDTATSSSVVLTISFDVNPNDSMTTFYTYIEANFTGLPGYNGAPGIWYENRNVNILNLYNDGGTFNISTLKIPEVTQPVEPDPDYWITDIDLTAKSITTNSFTLLGTWESNNPYDSESGYIIFSEELNDTYVDLYHPTETTISPKEFKLENLRKNETHKYILTVGEKYNTGGSTTLIVTTLDFSVNGTISISGNSVTLKYTYSITPNPPQGTTVKLYFKSLTINGLDYTKYTTTPLTKNSELSTSDITITISNLDPSTEYTFVYTIGDSINGDCNTASKTLKRAVQYTPPSGLSFTTSVTTKTMTITPKWTNGLKTATFKVFDASKTLKTSTTTSGTALTVSNLQHGTSFGYYYILSDGTTNIKVGGTSTSGYETLNFKTKTISIGKTITPSNTNHRLISCSYTGKIDNVTDTSVLKYKSLSVLLDGTSTTVSFSNSATLTANSSAANETFNISNLNPNTAYKIVYVITDGYNNVTNETIVTTTYPYVYIYTNGAWHKAIPYVYDKNTNTWKMIEAYKYTTNQFKVCL